MLKKIKNILKNFGIGLFILAFTWVTANLFFENSTKDFLTSVSDIFSLKEEISSMEKLKILYPVEPVSLEPTLNIESSRQRLINIYEPLVKFDRDLRIIPALALNWGLVDDFTWEFELRPSVKFHNGKELNVRDVIVSLVRAMDFPESELKEMLSSIENLKIINDSTFRIITKKRDPLLLQKLSKVLIFPQEYRNEENFFPVGTGPYKFVNWDEDLKKMRFEKFENYWGNKSKFKEVYAFSESDKNKRVYMLMNEQVDFLAFVPLDAAVFLQEHGFSITSIPSLEVQSIFFNFNSFILRDKKVREIISLAINQNEFVEFLGDLVRPVNQFLSNGIFGFSPNISNHKYDLEKAKKMAEEIGLKGRTLHFHLPIGLDYLGEHVRAQLTEIGVFLVVSYMDFPDLLKSMKQGRADIYFLGYRGDLGDGVQFFNSLIHTNGNFNVSNYSNELVDEMIITALTSLDYLERLKKMQNIMKIILEEDVIGVPLFEFSTVYAFLDNLNINPRIDGAIYFDDLIIK